MSVKFRENLSNSVYPADTVNLVGVQDGDEGKPVTMTGDTEFTLAADGGAIDGIIYGLNPAKQDGAIVGSVSRQPLLRVEATNKGVGALAIGDTVLAAAQVASGTVGKPTVKAGAGNWKVVSLLAGAGAVDTTVMIEKS